MKQIFALLALAFVVILAALSVNTIFTADTDIDVVVDAVAGADVPHESPPVELSLPNILSITETETHVIVAFDGELYHFNHYISFAVTHNLTVAHIQKATSYAPVVVFYKNK